MIYFTLYDHAVACLAFLFLGALFGVLYKSVNLVLDFLSRLFFIGIKALSEGSPFVSKKENTSKHPIKHRNIPDFLFFLILGILFLILSYVTLDGEIRIHTALILLLSFCVFEKFFSIPIEYILKFAFDKVYAFLFFVLYWLLIPLKILLRLAKRVTLPLLNAIRYKIYRRTFDGYRKKECKRIENFIIEIK